MNKSVLQRGIIFILCSCILFSLCPVYAFAAENRRLYRLEIDHNAEKEQQKKVEKPDLSGKSVLLVEDNELNLEIAKMLLEDEKMVVITAENAVRQFPEKEEK